MSQWMQCSFIQTNPTWGDLVCSIDFHDGGTKKPWHQNLEFRKRAESYRTDKEALAEDIRFALESPIESEVLDVIRENIEPEELKALAAPDYEPELKSLLSQTEALRKIARLVMEEHERQMEADDEEAIMLLH